MYIHVYMAASFSCLEFPNIILHSRLKQGEMKDFGQAVAKVYYPETVIYTTNPPFHQHLL